MTGDRFRAGKRLWIVQAIGASGRYMAVTRPFAARRTFLYSVVDLVAGVRGVDNSIGNSLGYETREECERAIALFESGKFSFSGRRRPIPLV